MKVLHVCQEDDAAIGGSIRVAAELVKEQNQQKIIADCVFLFGDRGTLGQTLKSHAFYLGGTRGDNKLQLAWKFWEFLNKTKPDVIHHHDGLVWTHLISRMFTKNCVGHGHLGAPQKNAIWKHRIAGWVHARTYQHLFCVSEEIAESWRKRHPHGPKLSILSNGINLDNYPLSDEKRKLQARIRLGIPEKVTLFCYVGRLHNEVKKCDDFLRTITYCPEHVWGLIVGTGPDENDLQQLAKRLGIEHRIRFTGLLDPVLDGYHASDAFLMTSCYEPFGLVVLEAASCGLPVVGFGAMGGVNTLMSSLGMSIIPERNPEKLASAALMELERFRVAPSRALKLREYIAKDYSWKAITAAVVDTYRNLINTAI